MVNALQFLSNGKDDHESVCQAFSSIEVEESVDLPGAMEITLPLDATNGRDLTYLGNADIQPYMNVSLVATAEGNTSECIFDGYVLSHKIHLDTGITNSSVKVWCQDSSWLMNMEERVHEWVDRTDRQIAQEIFKHYGITAAEENNALAERDDTAHYAESNHTLMQRETDFQFLKRLARRSGKLFRVYCKDRVDKRWGYFAKPNLGAPPAATLVLNPPLVASVHELDFEWDVARPHEVRADHVKLENGETLLNNRVTSSGLTALEARTMADFIKPQFKPLLSLDRVPRSWLTTVVDSEHELALRAASMLRESGFFVKCKGEADVAQLKTVLRAGTIVDVQGAGTIHSGKYYVWSVRHSIGSHSHKMNFVLVRNAVGVPPPGGL